MTTSWVRSRACSFISSLPILELSRHDEDLESLFFEMVNDRQEVAA